MRPQLRSALPTGSNLTPEQEAKLQQLSQAYNERVEAILTPEQQRQFRQNLEKFRQIREQARPGLERLRENQPRKPLE
jgi:Spy/CpxP family protein refolding chaperone